jgi:Flp pilus assembly protein TadD
MRIRFRRRYVLVAIFSIALPGIALPLSGVFASKIRRLAVSATKSLAAPDAATGEAARLNSIGVAYMGQQRFADAQKQFEAALKSRPDYALARLNLGVSLLSQQKSEDARKVLLQATENCRMISWLV